MKVKASEAKGQVLELLGGASAMGMTKLYRSKSGRWMRVE
jgi:hypothetical protein